jgi:protein-tyrosine phosphatase
MQRSSENFARASPLAGALNFRDMGGHRTAEGSSIQWNRLYRSGTLHDLTDGDLAWLTERGIRYAYDLRSNRERRDQPNRLQHIVGWRYAFVPHDDIAGDIGRSLRDAGAGRDNTRQTMLRFYRDIPYTFKRAFRALFSHLAAGDLPLVFNCSAGKDRAGVAAALIFSALEVPRASILEDYLLTEQCFEQSCDMFVGRYQGLFDGVSREVWEPLLRADADYLLAALDSLEAAHGSVVNYIHTELGVSPAEVARIRANLID